MRILLIEDNADLAASIGEYLEGRGHVMDYAYDGRTGLALASEGKYELLIVDIGLPGMDGLQLCRRLREDHQDSVPVLILTARDTLNDKIDGFSAGGDDYLVKPFAMQELEVRLNALHRRSQSQAHSRKLKVSDLEFDLDTLQIRREGQDIFLKPAARKLLEVLMRNSQRVVGRDELEEALWGEHPPDADALRVHIHSIRLAVDAPFDAPLIHTVRGTGYRLARID